MSERLHYDFITTKTFYRQLTTECPYVAKRKIGSATCEQCSFCLLQNINEQYVECSFKQKTERLRNG
jgi:hypothetical protein